MVNVTDSKKTRRTEKVVPSIKTKKLDTHGGVDYILLLTS
ncbi:MAG: hypothetical protein QG577_690 [Thermodesulfobacteriota bacterium]|nr:hypothetical protein [Thermodesulfobacteriota bacterium]